MKIVSKFSDYYDVGLSYGIDEKLRFERSTKVVEHCRYGHGLSIEFKKSSNLYRLNIQSNIIGFCGEIYPFVRVTLYLVTKRNKKPVYEEKMTLLSYEKEDIIEFIEGKCISFEEIEKQHKYDYRLSDLKNKIGKMFSTKEMKFDECYKAPYYCEVYEGTPDNATYNCYSLPILKQYHLSKVLAPLEAFQKLTMYLGAMDLKENEMVEIADKYLAQSKGFDCYSFKKMPSKGKVKRC